MRVVLPGLCLLLILAGIASLAVYLAARAKKKKPSEILFLECICWLAAYLAALLFVTVFSRRAGAEPQINLVPFRELVSIFRQRRYGDLAYPLLNTLLFVPEGLLVGALLRLSRKGSRSAALGIGLAAILAVEGIQYCTCRGVFDVDDILCNAAGFLLGYFVFGRNALADCCEGNKRSSCKKAKKR